MKKGKKEHLINLEGKIQAAMLAKKTDMTQDEIQDMLSEGKIQAAMMLRKNKEGGGMLSREQYGAGSLVSAMLKLRKGATKAPGRAEMEATMSKELEKLMKEHNESLAKLDSLKETGSEKQLKDLKDTIREETELIISLQESLDAFKNYSPGGRRGEATGGLLGRESFALGSIASKALKKMKSMPKKTKDSKVQDKSFREEIVELEDEMENLIQIRRSLEDEKRRKIKELGIPRMKAITNKEVESLENQIVDIDFEIDDVEAMLKELGVKPSAANFMERIRNNTGGLLSDDRQAYSFGGIIKQFIKQANKNKAKAEKSKSARQAMDDSTDMAERGMIDMEDAVKMLDEGVPEKDVKMILEASGYLKKDIDDLISVYKTESVSMGKMTQDEIFEEYDRLGMSHGGGDLPNEGLEALHKKEPELVGRMMAQEGGSMNDQMMMVMDMKPMESDDKMEDNYTQFIMEEALNDEEEDMLMSKLEQDEELQMLFDKVIDVAQEFAGSGPVEGPGSGVSDSIPARLSDGEFVFTAKAVKEIGEDKLMSMMKEAEAAADGRQGMAHGGTHMDSGEEEILSNIDKVSVSNRRTNLLDEDETTKNIKGNMINPNVQNDYVRS